MDDYNQEELFIKIAEPSGYPVAIFAGRMSHLRDDFDGMYSKDGTRPLPRESLVNLIENRRKAGHSTREYESALKALDEAIQIWAQTPWDGR